MRFTLATRQIDGRTEHRAIDDDGRPSRWYPDEAGLFAAIRELTGWRSLSTSSYDGETLVVERVEGPPGARAGSRAVWQIIAEERALWRAKGRA